MFLYKVLALTVQVGQFRLNIVLYYLFLDSASTIIYLYIESKNLIL